MAQYHCRHRIQAPFVMKLLSATKSRPRGRHCSQQHKSPRLPALSWAEPLITTLGAVSQAIPDGYRLFAQDALSVATVAYLHWGLDTFPLSLIGGQHGFYAIV